MNKNLTIAIKCLPFVFALHNAEEVLSLYSPTQTIHAFIYNPAQFIIAVSLFTLFGFTIIFGKRFYPTNRKYEYATIGFAGMLFLNSFFPHILSALYLRSFTPGVFTAILLILPLTSYILYQVHHEGFMTKRELLFTVFGGGIVGLGLVTIFLSIGYLFS